jgi:putative transposase
MELPSKKRFEWVDPEDSQFSLNAQLELTGLSKASYYYHPVPESPLNLLLMGEIDKVYTDSPFYGSRRITEELKRQGHQINRKRVIRLMQKMGLQAIFPKRNLSVSRENHEKYPYLLKGLTIDRADQVWATDITYIRVGGGYLYLTAIMDWYTRFILSWRLSNTLDVGFCLEALESALEIGKPEIFNSDQGCQYTSQDFTGRLKESGIKISMDGKGRCYDNILVERLWRSVKYEEVYVKRYETGKEAKNGLDSYLRFYNERRLHQSLGYRPPKELYMPGLGSVEGKSYVIT